MRSSHIRLAICVASCGLFLTGCAQHPSEPEGTSSVRGTTTPAETATPEERAAEGLQAVEITLPEGLTIVAVEDLEGFYYPDSGSWARTIEVNGDEEAVLRLFDQTVPHPRRLLEIKDAADLDKLDKFVFAGETPKNPALFVLPEPKTRGAQATLLFERPLGRVWILVEGGIR